MEKVKVLGLIVGIVGLALVFFMLITSATAMYDEQHYEQWESNIFAVSAILWSIAFTLGATAIVFYMERRAVYFMALSTIVEATGFIPSIERYARLNMDINSFIPIAALFMLPMLVSAILFAIPTKQQKGSSV